MRHWLLIILLLTPVFVKAEPADNVARGDSCLQAFDLFHALKYYQAALAVENTPAVCMKVAECHYRRGDYRACVAMLENVSDEERSHSALRQLCYSYRALGDMERFKQVAKEIIKRYPFDSEVLVDWARQLNQELKPERAFVPLSMYFLKDSMNLAVNRAIAETDFLMRDFVDASHDYHSLLAHGDTSYVNLFSLGVCYERRREYEDISEEQKADYTRLAREYFCQAIALSDSSVAGALYHQGAILNDLGQVAESQQCYLKAIGLINPAPTVAYLCWRGLAETYYKQKDYAHAVDAFSKAVDYDPTSLTSRFFLAVSLEAVGRKKEAATEYQRFIEAAGRERHPSQSLRELMWQARERAVGLKQ